MRSLLFNHSTQGLQAASFHGLRLLSYDLLLKVMSRSVNNSSQKSCMAMGEMSLCLSCHDIVALHQLIFNMTYLCYSSCQIFKLAFWERHAYVSMFLDERIMIVFHLFHYLSQLKKILLKTLILLKATLLFNLP